MEVAISRDADKRGTPVQFQEQTSVPLSAQLARHILELTVAAAFRIPSFELYARTRRNASVAFARQVAMYLAHVAYGLSLTDSGALFGRDRTTAAHACSVVEDRRDDPAFDVFLDHLEYALLRLARALHTRNSCT